MRNYVTLMTMLRELKGEAAPAPEPGMVPVEPARPELDELARLSRTSDG